MEMPEIHLEELKEDKEFLANIERLEREFKEDNSVDKAYKLLDAKLILEASEDEINEIFTAILNIAFDKLATYLTEHKSFDVVGDEEERAIARAIYEHAIQRYSENDLKGAREIFLVLYHTIDYDELQDAMMVHACVCSEKIAFDDFIDKIASVDDIDPYDPLAFFIQKFVEDTSTILDRYSEHIKQAKEELKVLQESKEGE